MPAEEIDLAWIRGLNRINLLRVYDVAIDIENERNLSSENGTITVLIRLYQQEIKFEELCPISSVGTVVAYCGFRKKAVELLKERGALKHVEFDGHAWNDAAAMVLFDSETFGKIYSALESEFELRSGSGSAQTDIGNVLAVLHPSIRELSASRLSAGNFADAVEASLKHLNRVIKELVKSETGKDLDGKGLMTEAFGVNRPIIQLDDIKSQSGRDIQEGYMHLFAGAMLGIRNPKAHDNLHITLERALHLLFLASLLMFKVEERILPVRNKTIEQNQQDF